MQPNQEWKRKHADFQVLEFDHFMKLQYCLLQKIVKVVQSLSNFPYWYSRTKLLCQFQSPANGLSTGNKLRKHNFWSVQPQYFTLIVAWCAIKGVHSSQVVWKSIQHSIAAFTNKQTNNQIKNQINKQTKTLHPDHDHTLLGTGLC